MTNEKDLRLVNTPNNIAKGRIEVDAQINKMYYQILQNIQRDNSELIIKAKKNDPLTQEQEDTLKKLDTMQVVSCRLSKDELASILHRKNDRTKEEIDKRFNALQSAIFKFTTGEQSSRMVQLIGAVDETADGYMVNVDAKLYKYLFYSLDVGYTPINLATLFNLTGQYSQALYVLLRSWTGTKREIEFTVSELREYFKTGTKYSAYKDFKKRCIVQAIEEINKTGSMIVEEFKEVKKGRSINSIIFIVNDLEPRVMPMSNNPKELQAPATKKTTEPIEWATGVMVSDKRIFNTLEAMYGDIKNGLVKNILKEAFVEFIKSDKYGKTVIDKTGLPYYMAIADRLLKEHEEMALGTGIYEPSFEAELYAPVETVEETVAPATGKDFDELRRKIFGLD